MYSLNMQKMSKIQNEQRQEEFNKKNDPEINLCLPNVTFLDQITKKKNVPARHLRQHRPSWGVKTENTPLRGNCDNRAHSEMKKNHPIIISNNPIQ